MTMRMLIDARHQEETRVAVVKGNRIEEFDFESAEHKQIKGNIYLAKVTRVEPSLQAAFIDYGGNRHGFLAFSEIHPDYYQIPREDREALLREEAEHAAEEERLRGDDDRHEDDDRHDEDDDQDHDRDDDSGQPDADEESADDAAEPSDDEGEAAEAAPALASAESAPEENAADELRRKRQNLRRRYKIQDVIRRRQVLLVQVVKEERGNKGAALTTYLSLAGRYCVLMPNTSHGGGISRKIPNGADRKRLKQVMADLNLPATMGCIVRTAGLSRTKTEIKRDFDYLARLWDEIRDRTLQSSAPALIYGDSDLVKRAIRDIYNRDIDEVIVEGEEGYRAARNFMKLLMPSHVRRVSHYVDPLPLFQKHGVEDQLGGMYQPVVQLKSGGYLVINPTEALVSIDINSGRSTREHNIEQTAYATNIEAAAEIARQLRLRDMAGLIVIDFIDMESSGHIRKVEKALKDAVRNDRARIQVGRISSFGLMEMSRQRLRTGVLEASTKPCPHCEGSGLMRTASSAGLSALRMLEDEAARGRGSRIVLRAGREAAVYVLNRKRGEIAEIEARYGVEIEVAIDETFEGARMSVESFGPPPLAILRPAVEAPAVHEEDLAEEEEEDEDEDEEEEAEDDREESDEDEEKAPARRSRPSEPRSRRSSSDDDADRKRRRRRRGRRGGRRRTQEEGAAPRAVDARDEGEGAMPVTEPETEASAPAPAESDKPAGPRRRPRARRAGAEPVAPVENPVPADAPGAIAPADEEAPKPRKRASRAKAKPEDQPVEDAPAAPHAANDENGDAAPPARPRAARRRQAAPEGPMLVRKAPAEGADAGDNDEGGSPRRGWWQRTFGA